MITIIYYIVLFTNMQKLCFSIQEINHDFKCIEILVLLPFYLNSLTSDCIRCDLEIDIKNVDKKRQTNVLLSPIHIKLTIINSLVKCRSREGYCFKYISAGKISCMPEVKLEEGVSLRHVFA